MGNERKPIFGKKRRRRKLRSAMQRTLLSRDLA